MSDLAILHFPLAIAGLISAGLGLCSPFLVSLLKTPGLAVPGESDSRAWAFSFGALLFLTAVLSVFVGVYMKATSIVPAVVWSFIYLFSMHCLGGFLLCVSVATGGLTDEAMDEMTERGTKNEDVARNLEWFRRRLRHIATVCLVLAIVVAGSRGLFQTNGPSGKTRVIDTEMGILGPRPYVGYLAGDNAELVKTYANSFGGLPIAQRGTLVPTEFWKTNRHLVMVKSGFFLDYFGPLWLLSIGVMSYGFDRKRSSFIGAETRNPQ